MHPKDPCKQEMCAYGPNQSTQILSTVTTCDVNCPKGFSYVNKDPLGKCCGECVHTECVFENKLYKPMQQWKSADNCTSYICEKKGNILMVSSSQEICPDVSSCPKDQLVDEGCCKICIKPVTIIENCKFLHFKQKYTFLIHI